MSISTSPAVRCPRCSAHVRAGSDWCTLCYSHLRTPPPASVEVPTEPVADLSAAPEQPAEPRPRGGKHARLAPVEAAPEGATAGPTPDEQAEALAAQMLAELAVSEAKSPLGPLAATFDTPGKRVALMIGGGVTAICLLLLLMAVAGALL